MDMDITTLGLGRVIWFQINYTKYAILLWEIRLGLVRALALGRKHFSIAIFNMVLEFKRMFSIFKHYIYFHIFFHSQVFLKNTNNVTIITLLNGP